MKNANACDRILTQFKKVEVEKILKSTNISHCEPHPDSCLQIIDLWNTSFFLLGGTDGAVLQYTGVKCGKLCRWVKFDQLIGPQVKVKFWWPTNCTPSLSPIQVHQTSFLSERSSCQISFIWDESSLDQTGKEKNSNESEMMVTPWQLHQNGVWQAVQWLGTDN